MQTRTSTQHWWQKKWHATSFFSRFSAWLPRYIKLASRRSSGDGGSTTWFAVHQMAAQSVSGVVTKRKREREEQRNELFFVAPSNWHFLQDVFRSRAYNFHVLGLAFDQTTHVPPSGERTPPHRRACVRRPASADPGCAAGGTSKEFEAERGCCCGGEYRERERRARRARRRGQSPQCVPAGCAVKKDVCRVSRMCALRSTCSIWLFKICKHNCANNRQTPPKVF